MVLLVIGVEAELAVTLLSARAVIRKPGADGETLAVTKYAVAILADAVETSRHLIVFHAATDLSILLVPVLTLKIVSLGRERQAGSPHNLALADEGPSDGRHGRNPRLEQRMAILVARAISPNPASSIQRARFAGPNESLRI